MSDDIEIIVLADDFEAGHAEEGKIVLDAPDDAPTDAPDLVRSAMKRYELSADVEEFRYNPKQPRAKDGKWTSGGGPGGGLQIQAASIKGADACGGEPCVDSLSRWVDNTPPPGDWPPERKAIHDQIVGRILDGVVAPEGQPTFVSMGGGGGSGKGYVLSKGLIDGVPDSKHAAHINSDDIKEMLPEYDQLRKLSDRTAAAWVHEESSYLAKRVQAEALDRGLNIVMDQVASNPDKVVAQFSAARERGYRVEANYVTVPVEIAIARAEERGKRSGRFVPESVLREAHKGATNAFQDLVARGAADKMTLVDNGGSDPVRLASYENGTLKIHNDSGYAAFKERGQ